MNYFKASVQAALLVWAGFSLTLLNGFASDWLSPRTPPDAVLDLQMNGFTCERAVQLIGSLNATQRALSKLVYTDGYDIMWPLSILANFAFAVYWNRRTLLSPYIILPITVFLLDMAENLSVLLFPPLLALFWAVSLFSSMFVVLLIVKFIIGLLLQIRLSKFDITDTADDQSVRIAARGRKGD
jgi:hypothetical protein